MVIDPSNRLADSYMLNNSKKAPLNLAFDSKIWNMPDWKSYSLKSRPDIWWNAYDGVKAGFHFNGNYLLHHHVLEGNLWINTGIFQDSNITDLNEHNPISYRLKYKTGLDKYIKHGKISLNTGFLAGLHTNQIGFEKSDYKKKTVSILLLKACTGHNKRT